MLAHTKTNRSSSHQIWWTSSLVVHLILAHYLSSWSLEAAQQQQQQQQSYQPTHHNATHALPTTMQQHQLQPASSAGTNYLETGRQITGILDRFMSLGYDKRVRPNYGGPPVEVNVTMRILSISSVSEVMMDFTADFYFRQTWHDPRLSFKKLGDIQTLYVGAEVSKKIWLPDTFFGNEKMAYFHEATTPNVFLRIDHSGEVYRSIRLTVTSSCPMNLQYFPMDRQRCTIEAESYGYNVKDIIYRWARKDTAVERDKEISLPQFDIVHTVQKYRLEELSSGTYSRLIAEIHFARRMGYYLIQIYIPSSLIVVISWVSFWLHRNASPARVQLGVTTVLTMTTLMSSTNAALPKISYVKSIDIFLGTCFVMVFAALLEYATVGYLGKRIAMRKAHAQHAQSQAQAKLYAQLQAQGAQGDPVPLVLPVPLSPTAAAHAGLATAAAASAAPGQTTGNLGLFGNNMAEPLVPSSANDLMAAVTQNATDLSTGRALANLLRDPSALSPAANDGASGGVDLAQVLLRQHEHQQQACPQVATTAMSHHHHHHHHRHHDHDYSNQAHNHHQQSCSCKSDLTVGHRHGSNQRPSGQLAAPCHHRQCRNHQELCPGATDCLRHNQTTAHCRHHHNQQQQYRQHQSNCSHQDDVPPTPPQRASGQQQKWQTMTATTTQRQQTHNNSCQCQSRGAPQQQQLKSTSQTLPRNLTFVQPGQQCEHQWHQLSPGAGCCAKQQATYGDACRAFVDPSLVSPTYQMHAAGMPLQASPRKAGSAAAAAAAAATFVNLHRKNKGLPPSTNPNFIPFSTTPSSSYNRHLETIFGIRPSDIDKYSRVVFPVCFVCFQLMYWIVYLHISAFLEPDQQSQQQLPLQTTPQPAPPTTIQHQPTVIF